MRTLNPEIFREYDIRGIADRDLDGDAVRALGRAIGTRLLRDGAKTIVLGRDCRLSSPRIRDALCEGLLDTGLSIIDVGVVPTPLVYFAIRHFRVDGGVQITGSLVLYHGVLSSHASWRAEILPRFEAAVPAHAHDGHDDRSGSLMGGCHGGPRQGEAQPPSTHLSAPQTPDAQSVDNAPEAPEIRARRLRWAQLLQRVFGLDVLKCTRCGGRREVLSFILRPAELKRICAHIGYPTEAPPIAPARAPPQSELWDQRDAG